MSCTVHCLKKQFLLMNSGEGGITENFTFISVVYFLLVCCINKNSSGDEIANVNFFTKISHTYFKTPKREPISFNKLDDS